MYEHFRKCGETLFTRIVVHNEKYSSMARKENLQHFLMENF